MFTLKDYYTKRELENKETLKQFAEVLSHLRMIDKERTNLTEDLASLLEEDGDTSINEYFDFIASGAYKECYDLSCEYVIKFASRENRSADEVRILDLAKENGLQDIFIETYHFSLPKHNNIPVTYLSPWDNEDELNHFAEVFIQPTISYTVDDDIYNEEITMWDYEDNPLRYEDDYGEENILDEDIFDMLGIESATWIRSVIDHYGYNYLERLANFIAEFGISDLHDKNIGYTKDGFPIIIDWLSC